MEITIGDIRDAANRLAGVAVRTPLLRLHGEDAADVWLKPEVFQPIGSYKIRGVYNALAKRLEREPLTEVTTISAGNTSQALAWSARKLGLGATAIMPDPAPEFKIQATRGYGAKIELLPREELFEAMRDGRFDGRPGFVHPARDPDMFAGNGTVGLEIIEDMPDVDTVIVPVGGGGLLIGIATAIRDARPNARILGVQPEGASALAASLQAGEPRETRGTTFVDGAGAPFVMEELFPTLQRLLDGCLTVSDDETKAAMFRLATKNKIVAEGAGALSVAAALKLRPEERGKTVCVVSGGSVDPGQLAEILLQHAV